MGSLSEAMALSSGNARIDAKGMAQFSSGNGGSVGFKIDSQAFNQTLMRVFVETKRTASETVRYAMILMLQAGRNATKVGKKIRRIERESGHGEFFRVFYQGKVQPKLEWLPWVQKTAGVSVQEQQKRHMIREAMIKKYSQIERVGLAKKSWGWALKKSCGKGSDALPGRGYRNDPISFVKTPLSLTVYNKLGWIGKLVPGIEERMAKSAEARMRHTLDRMWQSAIDRAARRAA